MPAITKPCVDCHKSFVFSQEEQDFYRARELADPKRCYPCRQAYKRKIGKGDQVVSNECFECNPKYVKVVVVDADDKCLACGRVIEKSVSQYPVLAHHLRDTHNS